MLSRVFLKALFDQRSRPPHDTQRLMQAYGSADRSGTRQPAWTARPPADRCSAKTWSVPEVPMGDPAPCSRSERARCRHRGRQQAARARRNAHAAAPRRHRRWTGRCGCAWHQGRASRYRVEPIRQRGRAVVDSRSHGARHRRIRTPGQ